MRHAMGRKEDLHIQIRLRRLALGFEPVANKLKRAKICTLEKELRRLNNMEIIDHV